MAVAIKMPDLGTNVEELRLVEWLKREGDPVQRGEPLCEVETDKATDQLESVAEGVLLRQVVPADSEVICGTIIAYVGQPGEVITEPDAAPDQPPATGASGLVTASSGPRVSPVVRNLAKRKGIELDAVTGTGPGGRITRADVLKATQHTGSDDRQGTPLSKQQLGVARRVSRSNREVPTIDLVTTLKMSAVIQARQKLIDESAAKVTYDSFFLYAAAQAIKKFPTFAAHVNGECLFAHDTIDICVAVNWDRKLYLPAVRSTDKRSLTEIQAEVQCLVDKTRNGAIRPDNLKGGCFTVSNLGMYPIDAFQMIIPPEQSGALAIGAIEERPLIEAGRIVISPVCTVVLSVDHRMINGAEAAEFLADLKQTLERI
jgi:pyruvate dehydrogenase E2 component (dihydrolipoamide acetyltransferase)